MYTMRGAIEFVIVGLAVALSALAVAQDGKLVDHGVGTPLAEFRGAAVMQDRSGRNLVIAGSCDTSPRGWWLITDIDTGKTEQIFAPEGVPNGSPYGSLLAKTGRFYTGQGRVLLELDPAERKWLYHGVPSKAVSNFMRIIEGGDGTIWAGDVYRAGLISFDPKTKETRDHGRMDETEQYVMHLAIDDAGWIYCGIGTQHAQLVAYHPKTGERRKLVPPEEFDKSYGYVQRSTDGKVYGRSGKQWYRLHDGKGEKIKAGEAPPKAPDGSFYWGSVCGGLPDGRKVSRYDLVNKYMEVLDPKTKQTKRIDFDYQSEGSVIRVLAAGPDGKVYANSAHPSRLIQYDPATGALKHFADPIALKGLDVQGKYLFGGHYCGGILYVLDTTRGWDMKGAPETIAGALGPRELVACGRAEKGHLVPLEDLGVVLLKAEEFGGEAHFDMEAKKAGAYHLLVATFKAPSYCKVQFLLDNKPVGQAFDAKSKAIEPGPVLTFGPFNLPAGKHRVGIRTLKGDYERPWVSIRSAALTERPPPEVIVPKREANPFIAGTFAPDINVPWGALAHPDGKHVLISGLPGYGYLGGGIAIYNLETKEAQLLKHTDLIENHSTMSMQALPNGDIAGCTSVSGGHGAVSVAKDAVIYVLDWRTKKVKSRSVPIPGMAEIRRIVMGPDGLLYCIGSGSTFFVFDVQTQKVVHQQKLDGYGSVAVNPMCLGPDGRTYLVLSKALLRIAPGTFAIEKIADTPGPANAGIAVVGGRVYFAVGSHLWSARI